MSNRIRIAGAAVAALVMSCAARAAEPVAPVAAASQAEPTTQADMSAEITALKNRLAQLETRQKQEEQRHAEAMEKLEQKQTADELAHDAQAQDHFLTAEGFTAGYSDGRFIVQSGDGNFVWRPWLHMQFRDVTNFRKDIDGTTKHPIDETDNGFEVRRMRFGFDGNLFSPDFEYFVNWATVRASSSSTVTVKSTGTGASTTSTGTVSNNLGGAPLLEEAWVRYHIPTSGFYLKLGQIKDPVLHDQIVSSRYQQSTERSLTADVFANGDAFTEGATVQWVSPHDIIHTEAGVNHGMRSANTNFTDYPHGTNAYDYGFVGRVEYKVMGKWKDYKQVGAVGVNEPLLVYGLGADYSERGHDGQLVAAADVSYADQTGFNFYGAFVDRYTTHNFGAYTQSSTGASIITPGGMAGRPTNEYGLLAEAGWIFNHKIEPFGRYELLHVVGDSSTHNWTQAVTGGVNYYFQGHRLKLTVQATWLPEGIPFDDTPSDILANSNGKSEVSFVGQLQWLL